MASNSPVLYQFLPDVYRTIVQPDNPTKKALLTAIIEALSEQDDNNFKLLAEARKQLFLNSATGKYLIDLAAQNGFNLPQRSGFDQTGISKLVVPVVNRPKQILSTINLLTELVYAASTLHPSFFTTQAEPYSLVDGDNITFKTDSDTVNVILRASSFSDITNISASELAGYINGTQQTLIFADTFYDRTVSARRLRVSCKTFGSSARLQCVGGTAQNILRFPNIISTYNTTGTNWIITKPASYNDITTFTWDGVGINPQTYNINIGDYCTIKGLVNSAFKFANLNGTYTVIDCGHNYFKIKTSNFMTSVASYTQRSSSELLFTSSYARTLYDNDQYALNYEPRIGMLNMNIPPIPSIVKREVKGATHLHGSIYPVSSFDQNSITVPYPNTLPSSGVFVLRSGRFSQEFSNRFYSYTSTQSVVGDSQSLSLNLNGFQNFPYLSETAAAPMKSIMDPLYATLDSNHYEIYTPGINLYMEGNMEFNLANIQFNRSPTPTSNNIYTVNSILLPVGSNTVDFSHARGSKLLYMQFRDSSTGEIIPLSYQASTNDPLNSTTISYGAQSAGKIVSATMVVCQTTFPVPTNEATLAVTRSITAGSGNVTINHNMNSTNIMFMAMNADTGAIVNAERLVVDANNVRFSYVNIFAGNYAFLIINMDEPAIPGVDTNPLRYKNLGITLLAAQTSVTVTHSLRASNIMVEVRKTGGLATLLNGTEIEFIRSTFVDQDTIRIDYINLFSNMTVDLFMVYDTKNTSTVSVDGGLLLSDINSTHIVRRVVSKDRFIFEINNPDGTPKNYQGAVVAGFNVVAALDPNGDYDAYLQFNTSLSRQDAKIVNGTKIKLIGTGTVSSQSSVAEGMRSRYLSVVTQSNDKIYLKTGVIANPGQIIAGEQCRCSASFGGSGVFLTVSPNSTWNSANLYSNLDLELISGVRYPTGLITNTPTSTQIAIAGNPNIVNVPTIGYVGSYIYDIYGTKTAFVVGGADGIASTSLTIQLASSPGVIRVTNVTGLSVSGGYLCMDFGGSQVEGPIRYYGITTGDNPTIIIDSAYVFKNRHSIGAKVYHLRSTYSYSPTSNGADHPAYLTGSIEARNAFIEIIRSVIAGGVVLNIEVQQPNLKNEEPGIRIF